MSERRRRELLALYVAWITVFAAAFAGGGAALGLLVDTESLGTAENPNVLGAADDVGDAPGRAPGAGNVGNVGNDGDTVPSDTDPATSTDSTNSTDSGDSTDGTDTTDSTDSTNGTTVGGGGATSPPPECPVVVDERSTDPDGDGRCEDVDGDGDLDGNDTDALRTHLSDDAVRTTPGAFDFNEDGNLNVLDVAALDEEVTEGGDG